MLAMRGRRLTSVALRAPHAPAGLPATGEIEIGDLSRPVPSSL